MKDKDRRLDERLLKDLRETGIDIDIYHRIRRRLMERWDCFKIHYGGLCRIHKSRIKTIEKSEIKRLMAKTYKRHIFHEYCHSILAKIGGIKNVMIYFPIYLPENEGEYFDTAFIFEIFQKKPNKYKMIVYNCLNSLFDIFHDIIRPKIIIYDSVNYLDRLKGYWFDLKGKILGILDENYILFPELNLHEIQKYVKSQGNILLDHLILGIGDNPLDS